jgi:hypothetical protein
LIVQPSQVINPSNLLPLLPLHIFLLPMSTQLLNTPSTHSWSLVAGLDTGELLIGPYMLSTEHCVYGSLEYHKRCYNRLGMGSCRRFSGISGSHVSLSPIATVSGTIIDWCHIKMSPYHAKFVLGLGI